MRGKYRSSYLWEKQWVLMRKIQIWVLDRKIMNVWIRKIQIWFLDRKTMNFEWAKYKSIFWMWKTMSFEWEKYRSGFRCEKQWVLNKKNRDLVLDVIKKKNIYIYIYIYIDLTSYVKAMNF